MVRPGYKQTEVGVIPEDWEVKGLLDAVKIANGQVDPKLAPFRSMPLVAPDHIESGTGKLLEIRTAEEQRAISGKYLFGPGDIVYSKIRPYLKKAILADFQGLCSADMYPMTPHQGVEGGYVFALLLAHQFTKYAESVSVRSGMPKINRVELADFNIPLPPLPEQRAIAAALADVDAALAGVLRLIAKKRNLKQAAMQTLLTGQTRLPGFSGDWEVMRLGDCLDIRPSYGINAAAVPFSDQLPAYIRITDIDPEGYFSPSPLVSVNTESTAYDLDPGDLVFARTGASVGKSYLYDSKDGRLVFAGFLIRIRPDVTKLFPRFLAEYTKTDRYWDWVTLMSMRSGQPGINGQEYEQLPLPLPTIEEQTAIAAVLSDMDAEIAALQDQADKTRLLKQAMMQDLLTGRVRLPLPEAADA